MPRKLPLLTAAKGPGGVVAPGHSRAGRFLVCQRPTHKRYRGLWEFPGGKLHDGETVEQAAVRGLHEELSVPVTAVG